MDLLYGTCNQCGRRRPAAFLDIHGRCLRTQTCAQASLPRAIQPSAEEQDNHTDDSQAQLDTFMTILRSLCTQYGVTIDAPFGRDPEPRFSIGWRSFEGNIYPERKE